MYGIYANKTGVYIDGKCGSMIMAYIRILWDIDNLDNIAIIIIMEVGGELYNIYIYRGFVE